MVLKKFIFSKWFFLDQLLDERQCMKMQFFSLAGKGFCHEELEMQERQKQEQPKRESLVNDPYFIRWSVSLPDNNQHTLSVISVLTPTISPAVLIGNPGSFLLSSIHP